jgi:hypothetical protein
MNQLTTVDFKHTVPFSGRVIRVCADFGASGNFLSWSATFYIAPQFFEMTGCVQRAQGETESQTVVASIGQALNARFR